MSLTGLKVSKIIIKDSEKTIEDKLVVYNEAILKKCKEGFISLKNNKTILNEKFDDNIWKMTCFSSRPNARFKHRLNPMLNNVLKSFFIIEILERNVEIKTAIQKLYDIQEIIDISDSFKIDNIDEYIDFLCDNFEDSTAKSKCSYICSFFEYYSVNNSDEYHNRLSNLSFDYSKARSLTHYSSIIEFDYLLHLFFEEASIHEKKRYFPILIWWRLTKVIPMRPSELTLIPKECLVVEDGKYFIKINRIKQKKSLKNAYKQKIRQLKKLEIDSEMVGLIEQYKKIAIYDKKDRFLVSYKLLNSTFENYNKEWSMKRKIEKDYIPISSLTMLLNEFYKKIISDKFNYTVYEKDDIKNENELIKGNVIEKIQLGDTRHLAFCSMMLQGFNPLTIAQIGGHTDLSSQGHYYQHIENLIKGNVNILSKRILSNIDKRYDIVKDFYNPKKLIKSQMIKVDEYNSKNVIPKSIQNGLCWNEQAPEVNCFHEDCFFCDYFTFNISELNEEFLDKLDLKFKLELEKTIGFLQSIYSEMKVDIINEIYSLDEQTKLKTVSRQIESLIAKHALIKSHILKSKEIKS